MTSSPFLRASFLFATLQTLDPAFDVAFGAERVAFAVAGSIAPPTGAALSGIRTRDGTAYVTASNAGLLVADVANASEPRWIGSIDTPGTAKAVALLGTLALVADGSQGLQVVDTADPTRPRIVGALFHPTATSVAAFDRWAFVAAERSGLLVLDLADPRNPRQVGQYAAVLRTFDVALDASGERAVIADGESGVQVLDVRDRARPVRLGGTETYGEARGILWKENHAFVADTDGGLRVVDLSDATAPHEVSSYKSPDNHSFARLVAGGHHVFAATSVGGLRALDVADLLHPVPAGAFHPNGVSEASVRDVARIDSRTLAVAADRLYLLHSDVGVPALGPVERLGNALTLSWNLYGEGMTLQRANRFESNDWRSVSGSATTNRVTVTVRPEPTFYRLIER